MICKEKPDLAGLAMPDMGWITYYHSLGDHDLCTEECEEMREAMREEYASFQVEDAAWSAGWHREPNGTLWRYDRMDDDVSEEEADQAAPQAHVVPEQADGHRGQEGPDQAAL